MRISSSQWFRQSLGSLLEQQTVAARTQQQLASGKSLLKPSDDPVAAARALDLDRAIDKLDQYGRNVSHVENRLRLQESALDGGIDLLQRVRELAVQANNGTQSDETRGAIAAEIEQLREAMLQQANRQDGNGHYLFGGYSEDQAPYMTLGRHALPALQDATGNRIPGVLLADGSLVPAMLDPDGLPVQDTALNAADYAPVASGQRQISVGATATVADSDPALAVFQYSGGGSSRDILASIQLVADSLRKPVVANGTIPLPVGSQEAATLATAMADALTRLDTDIGQLSDVRTSVGARLNQLDVQRDIQAESSLQLQSTRSDLVDVDYAEAAARLNQQLTGLQAAQQVFSKVQGMSLFDFM